MSVRVVAAGVVLLVLSVMSSSCQTQVQVTFVNPTDAPLFVQVNEREPFEVAPRSSLKAPVPGLERLKPILIVARDGDGRTVYALTTSMNRIEATPVVELRIDGPLVDPLADPALINPALAP